MTSDLCAHIERAYEDMIAGSVPIPLDDVVAWVSSAEHVEAVRDEASDRIVAHAEVTRSRHAPHRASVSAAVEREFWGRGVGKRVLGAALAWCDDPANGIEYVDGWAWADNERALRMDAALGFVEVGRVVDAYRDGDRKRDQVIMVRQRRG